MLKSKSSNFVLSSNTIEVDFTFHSLVGGGEISSSRVLGWCNRPSSLLKTAGSVPKIKRNYPLHHTADLMLLYSNFQVRFGTIGKEVFMQMKSMYPLGIRLITKLPALEMPVLRPQSSSTSPIVSPTVSALTSPVTSAPSSPIQECLLGKHKCQSLQFLFFKGNKYNGSSWAGTEILDFACRVAFISTPLVPACRVAFISILLIPRVNN